MFSMYLQKWLQYECYLSYMKVYFSWIVPEYTLLIYEVPLATSVDFHIAFIFLVSLLHYVHSQQMIQR